MELFGGAEHSESMAPPPMASPPADPNAKMDEFFNRPFSLPPTPTRSNTVAPPPLQGSTVRDQVFLRSRQNPALGAETAVVDEIRHRKVIPTQVQKADIQSRFQTTNIIPAGVQQSVAAPVSRPVSPPVQPQQFSPAVPTVQWFMLPRWMAGRWTKKGDLTISTTNLRTGATQQLNEWIDDELTATWGHQTDRAGNVWHADFLPFERDGRSYGKFVKFLTTMMTCESTDAKRLVTRTHYLVSEFNPNTGQILEQLQQESLNHYRQLTDGELVNNNSTRVFSYTGQPIRDGVIESRYKKVSQFVPIPVSHNIDLVQSLRQYLLSHGMANLAQ